MTELLAFNEQRHRELTFNSRRHREPGQAGSDFARLSQEEDELIVSGLTGCSSTT